MKFQALNLSTKGVYAISEPKAIMTREADVDRKTNRSRRTPNPPPPHCRSPGGEKWHWGLLGFRYAAPPFGKVRYLDVALKGSFSRIFASARSLSISHDFLAALLYALLQPPSTHRLKRLWIFAGFRMKKSGFKVWAYNKSECVLSRVYIS